MPMNHFEKNTIRIYGKHGKQWLKSLPKILGYLSSQYQHTNLHPVADMSFNYVQNY